MYMIAKILLLAAPALATVSVSTESNTLTHYGCTTRVASTRNRVAVKTSTVSSVVQTTGTATQAITTTPIKTVQARPITTTVTSTKTSTVTTIVPTVTGTYLSTLTVDNTVTATVTIITVTETVDSGVTVSTTVTSTILQPTPSGFIDATDSTGQQNAVAAANNQGRSLVDSARRVAEERRRSPAPAVTRVATGAGALPAKSGGPYPQQVLCTKTLETVLTVHSTYYARTAIVTVPGPMLTVTTTSTATSTSTKVPSATVTLTATSIATVTSFVTGTITTTYSTTATMTVSTTTHALGACATNNLLGPSLTNGNGVYDFNSPIFNYGVSVVILPSAYDCCTACQTSTDVCFASYYGDNSNCYLVTSAGSTLPGGVCSPTYQYGNIVIGPGAGQYVVSNGPCGILGPV